MCLVVDANQAGVFFGKPNSETAAPIWAWLQRDGILVYGGKLAAELGKHGSARKLLLELSRAGKAILESQAGTEAAAQAIRKQGGCLSNDLHVLALAWVSGARVLFTEDKDLIRDFKNLAILKPKGRIYRSAAHHRLLGHVPGCRKPR